MPRPHTGHEGENDITQPPDTLTGQYKNAFVAAVVGGKRIFGVFRAPGKCHCLVAASVVLFLSNKI